MSRGRPPANGILKALPLAKTRGRVMEIVQNGDTPAMFVMAVDKKIIFVYIRRADPFTLDPVSMEAEHRSVIALIRSLPGSADILREIWFYSKAGSLRFFRVEESWLLEIGRDGNPLGETQEKPRVEFLKRENNGDQDR